ncbi:hypothetical protein [Calderihabitans maritimus]|uniref:Uncharacterized protein n=1 Tax=Calderihabitans maritimus TaxID=1246530 RepID=A0A1Z5HP57_9FIRM|nr:hypothetical protein [Calderihabitans maritimus]GAW91218.1 hypothetical protein KKC1_03800 [Calderihabitans maritimus]
MVDARKTNKKEEPRKHYKDLALVPELTGSGTMINLDAHSEPPEAPKNWVPNTPEERKKHEKGEKGKPRPE